MFQSNLFPSPWPNRAPYSMGSWFFHFVYFYHFPSIFMKFIHDGNASKSPGKSNFYGHQSLRLWHYEENCGKYTLVILMDEVIHKMDPVFWSFIQHFRKCNVDMYNVNLFTRRMEQNQTGWELEIFSAALHIMTQCRQTVLVNFYMINYGCGFLS